MPEIPSWHAEPWCALLRRSRAEIGPKRTADLIGYSPPVVIAVCDGTYPANPARVKDAVLAALGSTEIPCPVLGTISHAECRRHRTAEFAPTNPTRIRLWRTCPTCIHNPNATP